MEETINNNGASTSSSVEKSQQQQLRQLKPTSSSSSSSSSLRGAKFYCAVILWTLIAIWSSGVVLFVYYINDGDNYFFPTITEPAFLGGAEQRIEEPLVRHDDARLPMRWPLLPLKSRTTRGDYDLDGVSSSTKKAHSTYESSVLILTVTDFQHAQIKIALRPDLSEASVRYLYDLVQQGCARCYFHRKITSEQTNRGFILGTMANHNVPVNTIPGTCPHPKLQNKDPLCSVWNTNPKFCGCHGPILTKGMVGWVEGTNGGPDFFINTQSPPLEQLGTKYTVFGQVMEASEDSASNAVDGFDVLEQMMDIKGTQHRAQAFPEKIRFRLLLEE